RYQGVVDWRRVPKSGIVFAFARVSDGLDADAQAELAVRALRAAPTCRSSATSRPTTASRASACRRRCRVACARRAPEAPPRHRPHVAGARRPPRRPLRRLAAVASRTGTRAALRRLGRRR
ncbi:MAG: hypothetical protein LC659_15495, partial [Myxococcales bacterium]|nr:hypothetical protein [Myxococcales bacterium]